MVLQIRMPNGYVVVRLGATPGELLQQHRLPLWSPSATQRCVSGRRDVQLCHRHIEIIGQRLPVGGALRVLCQIARLRWHDLKSAPFCARPICFLHPFAAQAATHRPFGLFPGSRRVLRPHYAFRVSWSHEGFVCVPASPIWQVVSKKALAAATVAAWRMLCRITIILLHCCVNLLEAVLDLKLARCGCRSSCCDYHQRGVSAMRPTLSPPCLADTISIVSEQHSVAAMLRTASDNALAFATHCCHLVLELYGISSMHKTASPPCTELHLCHAREDRVCRNLHGGYHGDRIQRRRDFVGMHSLWSLPRFKCTQEFGRRRPRHAQNGIYAMRVRVECAGIFLAGTTVIGFKDAGLWSERTACGARGDSGAQEFCRRVPL